MFGSVGARGVLQLRILCVYLCVNIYIYVCLTVWWVGIWERGRARGVTAADFVYVCVNIYIYIYIYIYMSV
jgi:hypothetical protein